MVSNAVIVVILGFVILGLFLVVRHIRELSYDPQAGNFTNNNAGSASNRNPPTQRQGGFIVLNSPTPSNTTNIATNNTSINKSTARPFIITDHFKTAPKLTTPNTTMSLNEALVIKPPTPAHNLTTLNTTMKLNGALVIKPPTSAPVSSTKSAAPTLYKPPVVPSVWGTSARTNPSPAQQLPIISPLPISSPPTEYTNSLGIRLQVAPNASSTLAPSHGTSASPPPPAYARTPQDYGQTLTTITIDDQTSTTSTFIQPCNPQQQQPDALEDIQFSSHPRPSVAIVINDDESNTNPGSTTI